MSASSISVALLPVDLSGRVALVTGTTSGLGRRFATVLAAAGAHVAAAGRRAERLDELAEEIRAAGGHCTPVPRLVLCIRVASTIWRSMS